MQLNIGPAEQIVRGIVGAGLIVTAGLGALDGAWQALAVTLGSIGVFTASAGFCPIYRALGLGRPQRTRAEVSTDRE
jgi:hypothetical protein